MKLIAKAVVVFEVLLLAALATGQSTEYSRPVLVPVRLVTYVFMVSDSGSARQLPIQLDRVRYGRTGLGDSGPLISPDGRWIAFTRHQELHLLDVSSCGETRVTSVNSGCPDLLTWVVWIAQWAADSRSLLYSVSRPGFSDRVHGCPRDQGYFIYDVDAGSSSQIAIPGSFECWLPNGDLVLSTKLDADVAGFPSTRGCDLVLSAPDGAIRHLPSIACSSGLVSCFGQITCDPQGSHLAMHYKPTGHLAQIVELDIASGRLTALTDTAEVARFQWPFYSPKGLHIAWFEYLWDGQGTTETAVRVDGRAVFKCMGRLGHDNCSWISDKTMAVACRDSLYIVDVQSGGFNARPISVSE